MATAKKATKKSAKKPAKKTGAKKAAVRKRTRRGECIITSSLGVQTRHASS